MSKKVFGEALVALLCLALAKWAAGPNLQPELYGMCIGFLLAILLELLFFLYDYRKFLHLFLQCRFSKKELRLSISYLFNIEVNGKYLLVKSNRLADTYQPVGGVYKYFSPEAKEQLVKIGVVTDNAIENDEISEYDLRIKLRERKRIKNFLDWFFSGENREVNPWREFYEELVAPGFLPADKFGYLNYVLIGQCFEKVHYDKFFKIDTFKYADIYRPKYVTHDQEKEIRCLCSKGNDEYIWVTEEDIMQGRNKDGKRIAEHTKKIFHTNKFK